MPDPVPDAQPPQPGDPAPWFVVEAAVNPTFHFSALAGRYILLAFAGPSGSTSLNATIRALRPLIRDGVLDDDRAVALVIVPGARRAALPPDQVPGYRVMADPQLAAHRDFRLTRPVPPGGSPESALAVFLVDPQLRVLATAPLDRLGQLTELLRRLPPPHLHAGTETPAPVLLVPRVFESGLCQHLIEIYRRCGGIESGFMEARDGRTIGVLNNDRKRRSDCPIEDPDLQAAIRGRIIRRLVPEIRKAYQYDPTRIERYIVACYDGATGGHFAAHRDNTTPGTAHRRFAVTINLNDGFEGGELRFPEFGPRRFRPPPGGAVVFSCSLLHEAMPVTSGTRYTFLPFLYDDAAATIREANKGTIESVPIVVPAAKG